VPIERPAQLDAAAQPPDEIGRRFERGVAQRVRIAGIGPQQVGEAARCPPVEPRRGIDDRGMAVAQAEVVRLDRTRQRAVLGERDGGQPADLAVCGKGQREARAPCPEVVRPRVVRPRVDQAGEARVGIGKTPF